MRILLALLLLIVSQNSFAELSQSMRLGQKPEILTGGGDARDDASCVGTIGEKSKTASQFVDQCKAECKWTLPCESLAVSFCNNKHGCDTPGCSAYISCPQVPGGVQDASPSCPRDNNGKCVTSTPTKPTSKPPSSSSAAPTPSGNLNVDMQTCQQAQQQASNCCNNPESCLSSQTKQQLAVANGLASSGNTQGLKDYCQQMNATGNMSRSINEEAAAACRQRFMGCASTCNSFAQTYSTSSSASQFLNIAQQCNALQSRVQAMGKQGLLAGGSSANAGACDSITQSQPQSIGSTPQSNQADQVQAATTNNPNDPTGCISNPASAQCQTCTANPNDPSCRAVPQQMGTSSFSGGSEGPMDTSEFDVSDTLTPSTSLFDVGDIPSGQPAKNGTVANNTGGGVGGSGGGGGGSASLGGSGSRRPSPGSPGYSTDILQGHLSGGYSEPGGSGDTSGSGSGGWSGYGGRNPASNGDNRGMDLKQFLPGHKNAPAFVGGAYTMHSKEIAGKHGDIFEKMSRKLKEMCMLGKLLGCEN